MYIYLFFVVFFSLLFLISLRLSHTEIHLRKPFSFRGPFNFIFIFCIRALTFVVRFYEQIYTNWHTVAGHSSLHLFITSNFRISSLVCWCARNFLLVLWWWINEWMKCHKEFSFNCNEKIQQKQSTRKTKMKTKEKRNEMWKYDRMISFHMMFHCVHNCDKILDSFILMNFSSSTASEYVHLLAFFART